VISTPDRRVRVFISSTMGELAAERRAAADAITQLRLTPVLFELGARPYPPRDLYRAYLQQSDVFVGIYAGSYGWVAPDMEVSGLEDEYRLSDGKPRLIYLKRVPEREPRLASLLIDRAGHARIGVWGKDVPVPGYPVYTVRQNLWLLVSGGRPTAEAGLWRRWGGTIGGLEHVARSALGESATGTFMYAASMSTIPADLAWALARMGARVDMELDINPQWIQLNAATRPGGRLKAEVPGQHRPANQYLAGWTRDFIAVLAPAAG